MKESLKKDFLMEKVVFNLLIRPGIQDIFKMVLCMDLVHFRIIMLQHNL